MIFKRDNSKNKVGYYAVFILVEMLLIGFILYLGFTFWLLTIPFILIDIVSNYRCLKRQKNYIKQIEISDEGILCLHNNDGVSNIPLKKAVFSIREKKFEKEKIEIEIKRKKWIGSQLIGRIHISNWSNILSIKQAFIEHSITQVKYRPEGYWSKYGSLTADVIIVSTIIATDATTHTGIADLSQLNETAHQVMEVKEEIESIRKEKDKPTH